MKACNDCGQRLWSTDKGVCPTCRPDENRAVYGLKPLQEVVFKQEPTIKTMIDTNPLAPSLRTQKTKGRPTNPAQEGFENSESLENVIKSHILKSYELSGKNKSRAANKLGITVKTLYNHLDRYGVV